MPYAAAAAAAAVSTALHRALKPPNSDSRCPPPQAPVRGAPPPGKDGVGLVARVHGAPLSVSVGKSTPVSCRLGVGGRGQGGQPGLEERMSKLRNNLDATRGTTEVAARSEGN